MSLQRFLLFFKIRKTTRREVSLRPPPASLRPWSSEISRLGVWSRAKWAFARARKWYADFLVLLYICVIVIFLFMDQIVFSFPAYYYNKWRGGCEPFLYSGCRGNGNRFLTLAQCESACHRFMPLEGSFSKALCFTTFWLIDWFMIFNF